MRKTTRLLALISVTLIPFALPAAVEAQIGIGQLAGSTSAEEECSPPAPFDEWQIAVSAGTSYAVPTAGVITAWSTNAGPAPKQRLGFKVFRPSGTGSYLVAGQDATRMLAPSVLNTFPVSIPVQAGDIIGLYVPILSHSSCAFPTLSAADQVAFAKGGAPAGSAISPEGLEGEFRLNVSASLLQPPTIAAISRPRGSVTGGSQVSISGANFAAVGGVSFGAVPATSYVVNSETQLTAVAPPNATLTKVPITITTVAGAATSTTRFAYEGCVVPKLKGLKLKASKRKLKKVACKIGAVKKPKGVESKFAKVKKQNPRPGKILAPGSKIDVKLGG